MTSRKNIHTQEPYSDSKIIFNGGGGVREGQDLLRKTKFSLQFYVKLQPELYSIIIQ